MASTDQIASLASLLRGGPTSTPLTPEQRQELILRGAVAALEEALNASPDDQETREAAALLRETAAAHPFEGARIQALHALMRSADEKNIPAIDALYQLAVENDLPAARQAIITGEWQPSRPTLRALFDWFTVLDNNSPFPEEYLPALTQAYFEDATPALQRRLVAGAPRNGADNWARIVSAIQDGSQAALRELIERYAQMRPVERDILLQQLSRLAEQTPPASAAAREALAGLFIRHEEPRAREMILANDYLPDDSETRALLFFLGEDWARYAALDFDYSLLAGAYERAGRSLRRRLMEHSRRTGQMEWLRTTSLTASGTDVRWINDLTDADWELAIRRLSENERENELWHLAQVAPPIWSAAILKKLAERGWQPQADDDRAGFALLAQLAVESLKSPLAVRPKKALHTPICEITCLAVHPAGNCLAAGTSDQRVYLWTLPDGRLREPPLIGPSPVTRSLAYSPDGDLLACANGDNRIRVFRTTNGHIVKTFDGHQALIRALVIHPDGRMLYSASFDGSLRFWRFPHGAALKTIRTGSGEVFGLVLVTHGAHLVSGGADGLLSVWALPDGAAARELDGHTGTITHMAATGASELVASAGRDGSIRLWNVFSGIMLRSFPSAGQLTALAMHPNEQVLAGGATNGTVTLWNLSTGRVIEQLTAHRRPVTGLVFSPDGNRLYSADSSASHASIQVWDLQSFLAIRLPGEFSKPGAAAALQERINGANIEPAEKKWLEFSAELARWRQRYDIEISEFETIPIGEFDIEIA